MSKTLNSAEMKCYKHLIMVLEFDHNSIIHSLNYIDLKTVGISYACFVDKYLA